MVLRVPKNSRTTFFADLYGPAPGQELAPVRSGRHKVRHVGPDDYDVIDDIGRIFKPRAGVPEGLSWIWSVTGAVVAPDLPPHGFCASLEEAKAKFAETRRAWMEVNR